uniref:Mediator of RNA polymerase II transcription subunit 13 n=1 Tax=Hyaloperonospora arabidopsidis (strain Emoy2) TaxID=559515 RepID=M4BBH9_HYAAE
MGICESRMGSWTGIYKPLDGAIQKLLFAALASVLSRKLLAQEEFVLSEEGLYEPNDAKFIFRCPSLTRLNDVEVYLEEDCPTPAFQLHLRLFHPSNLLAVTVGVVRKEGSVIPDGAIGEELGDPRCSWERLVGLPSYKDHSVVDVWHPKHGLVPRIVAGTKYTDETPWFRPVSKRRHKRRSDDGDSGGVEEEAKDENEEDADEDDDENNQEVDVDADELSHRPVSSEAAKAKKKQSSADSAENDEFYAPVSPDTHINTPDAIGPIIQMTLPQDDELHLQADADVRHFKRRRKGYNAEGTKDSGFSLTFGPIITNGAGPCSMSKPLMHSRDGVKKTALDPAQLFSVARTSLSKSVPTLARPKNDVKPLSVAVSLVESLSHSEQQEALDGRPVKTHPMLQALQDYVDEGGTTNVGQMSSLITSAKVKFLPNAKAFIPSPLRATVGRLSINCATARRLRLGLCSDRFSSWRSKYVKLQYPRNGRQQKLERQRRLLIEFDEAAFEDRARKEAAKSWGCHEKTQIRDGEILLGIQMAASDAMVTWRQEPYGIKAWSAHFNLDVSTANVFEKSNMVNRVQPYLRSLMLLLKKEEGDEFKPGKTRRDRRWMSFKDYVEAQTTSTADRKCSDCIRVAEEPKLCVSNLESSYHVKPAMISEYLLRDLHPVTAPKSVDYVIVCPQSPSQWLASLALSYFTCFRSMYAQCHMGDLVPVDLGQVEGNHYARVDAANGLLLVDCADSTSDPFANFRAAGKLLNPMLSSGAMKKAQAFSRSAVANVVYLVVPFRRTDVKHKMWILGAFSHGLFDTEKFADVSSWKDSVTIEMVYLDDLYEVEVNPSPYVLMPNCFGLYDRVHETLNLKLVDGVVRGAGRSRFLCERLYHLADWRAGMIGGNEECQLSSPYVYGGYLLSKDRKWVACSFTDAVGSILETYTIPVENVEDGSGLESAFLGVMLKMLNFLALFGEKSVLVVTRLTSVAGASRFDEREEAAWETLRSNRLEELIPPVFQPLLTSVLLLQLDIASQEEVQLREDPSAAALYVSHNLGFAVMPPPESTGFCHSSRAVIYTGYDAWKSTSLLHAQHTLTQKREARVLRVTPVLALLEEGVDSKDGKMTGLVSASTMITILRDFHAQSYLTMHPITMERQSPLPHHLAAISKTGRELQVLDTQLMTDPLQLR